MFPTKDSCATLTRSSTPFKGPLIELHNPRPIFYNGNPYSDPSSLFDVYLRPLAGGAFGTPMPFVPLSPDGSRIVPTAYLHTLDDLSVPTKVQKQVLDKYVACISDVIDIPGGHLWMVNCPELATEGLIKFAAKLEA